MEHVETAKRTTNRPDLEKRLTGRFYTPKLIADRIAAQAINACPDPESVCDPFCGDGRLIVAWLRIAAQASSHRRLRRIVLWDYDAEAVTRAREWVSAELSGLGLISKVSLIAEAGDTFARTSTMIAGVEAVLTNPPWELLKPDTRDGVDDAGVYKGQLRGYASTLAKDFPGAMSARGKAMSGYGVNLARAGAVASAMLTSARGVVSIVLPSSIFADQASGPFRREFFSRLGVTQLDWYPAEARLFDGVDQPFVTATAVAGYATSSFTLTRYGKDLDVVEQRHTTVSSDASKPIAISVAGEHETLVATLASTHSALTLLEADMRFGLWLGRELDETRLAEAYTEAGSGIPFLKGRHVFPFQIFRNEQLLIDPAKRPIPSTVKELRLAWRDVSRPNQRRRMHVALVPQGYVTGNSLGIAYFRYGPLDQVKVLMAIMNSMAFELQVRTQLATAHVSQGVLRRCSVPLQCFEEMSCKERILNLVDSRLNSGEEMPELEVTVARAYGMARDEFASMLGAFPKLTPTERAAHLQNELWL
ncbi:MAG TPA: N-6 DNA methylase [Candidatus Fermentibacter daniensis]|nr:N-6 DNA methylase [Candidatus Fermentibacter daniensis]HPO34249.1 N-6 DNA methylase [Deltaproteobacteria bacterium]